MIESGFSLSNSSICVLSDLEFLQVPICVSGSNCILCQTALRTEVCLIGGILFSCKYYDDNPTAVRNPIAYELLAAQFEKSSPDVYFCQA